MDFVPLTSEPPPHYTKQATPPHYTKQTNIFVCSKSFLGRRQKSFVEKSLGILSYFAKHCLPNRRFGQGFMLEKMSAKYAGKKRYVTG